MKQLILILTLFISVNLFAQVSTGSLQVSVVDENGDVFFGASVAVYDGDRFIKRNATDSNGSCSITGLEPGDYSIRVIFIGYQPFNAQVNIISNITTELESQMEYHSLRCCSCCIIVKHKPMITDYFGVNRPYSTDQILKMPVR
ncbi:MAG: carboxypeptidase regulatory-like domain-containing protein [Bacteroidia bacterium]